MAQTEAAIARGRQLTKLQRQIKVVEAEIQVIEETAARLGLQVPRASTTRRKGSDRKPARSADVQSIPNGAKVTVPRGWEAVVTGYLGENRYSIRYNTGLPGEEDSYPAHCLTIE
ncbi:hypothetical protein NDI52_30130 [Leptolyngbya sp. PL-A3]|uniref:hypothetical protein n=1 Tax=Leptolyngbya sp. PL-A3 TaxID=2933911 RepID=UPI0032976EBF